MSAGAESGAEELEARLWAAVTNFDVAGAREALGLGADPNGGQSKGVVLTSLAISWGRSEPGEGANKGARAGLLRELLLAGAKRGWGQQAGTDESARGLFFRGRRGREDIDRARRAGGRQRRARRHAGAFDRDGAGRGNRGRRVGGDGEGSGGGGRGARAGAGGFGRGDGGLAGKPGASGAGAHEAGRGPAECVVRRRVG